MQNISERDLLSVWEFGVNNSLIETCLLLLSYAYPDFENDEVAAFSIGERDIRLLHIREALFGSLFQNTSDCSSCGQKMEWETTVDMFKLQPINVTPHQVLIQMALKNNDISIRLPNSLDIMEVESGTYSELSENQLLEKCIVNSSRPIGDIDKISQDFKEEIFHKMEEKDPQANIQMNLACPECENEWTATFDIMQYLWVEINEWAIQLMNDIYLLARDFGWSENDILNMNRFRRKIYINMINE